MARKTIKLKDYLKVVEEYPAEAAITPGMLVEVTDDKTVQANSAAGDQILVAFATEDEFQGKTIDDAYAADDPVQVWIPQRGDVAYAWLAAGEDVDYGESLTTDAAGRLIGVPTAGGHVVAQALEAVDSGTNPARIIVRIV